MQYMEKRVILIPPSFYIVIGNVHPVKNLAKRGKSELSWFVGK